MALTLFVFLLLFIILASCTTSVDQDSYSISSEDDKKMSLTSKKHQKKASRIYFNDYPYIDGSDLLDEDDQASNIDPSIRLLLDSTLSLCEAKMIKSFQDQIEKKINFPNCRNSNYCNSPLKKSKGRDHFCTDCYRYYLNTLKLRKDDSIPLGSLPKTTKNATSATNATTTTMVTRSKSGKRATKQKSHHSSTIDSDSFDDQNKDQPKKEKKKAKKQSKDDNTNNNKKNKKTLSIKPTIKGKNSSSNKNNNVNALEKDTKIIAEIFKKFKKDLASNANPFECLNIYCKNRVSNADARKKNRICTSCYSYYMRTRQLNGKKKGIEYKFRLSSDDSSLKVQKDKKTKDTAEHLRKERNNKTLKNKRQAENEDENEKEEKRSTDDHEKDNDHYDNFYSDNENYSLSKDEHYSDKETTAKEESFYSPHGNDDDYHHHYYYQDSPRDDNIYSDEKDDSEDDKGKDSTTSPLPQEEIEKFQPEKKTIVTMLNEFKNYIAMTSRGSKCRNLLCNNELGRNDDCICQDCYTYYLNFGKLREDEDEDEKEK